MYETKINGFHSWCHCAFVSLSTWKMGHLTDEQIYTELNVPCKGMAADSLAFFFLENWSSPKQARTV